MGRPAWPETDRCSSARRGCLEEEDAWRVRVTVYDAQRPHLVSSPESPSLDLMSVPVAMATPPPHDGYLRQQR